MFSACAVDGELIATRPGLRVWRADASTGKVLATLIYVPASAEGPAAPTQLGRVRAAGLHAGVRRVCVSQHSRQQRVARARAGAPAILTWNDASLALLTLDVDAIGESGGVLDWLSVGGIADVGGDGAGSVLVLARRGGERGQAALLLVRHRGKMWAGALLCSCVSDKVTSRGGSRRRRPGRRGRGPAAYRRGFGDCCRDCRS